MKLNTISVFCASSRQCDQAYHDAAFRLGKIIANEGASIIYGGGAVGSMGHLASGALSAGGKVIGVIPKFMYKLEWGHEGITELIIVDDMHARKQKMMENTDAIVALPGGSGTLEELFEAISLKRLGFYLKPIVIVNVRGFFDPCIKLLENMIEGCFMDKRHSSMWSIVEKPEQVLEAIYSAPKWAEDARQFAAI